MKNNILEVLKDKHEAQTLIQINDLLGLSSAEELKQLELTLEELVNEYHAQLNENDLYILNKKNINKKDSNYLALDSLKQFCVKVYVDNDLSFDFNNLDLDYYGK